MHLIIPFLVLLFAGEMLACSDGFAKRPADIADLDDTEFTDDSDDSDDSDDTDGDSPSYPPVLQALLDGDLQVEATLDELALTMGWPALLDGHYLFLRRADGFGPYSLAGDHNDWHEEAMHEGDGFFWLWQNIPEPVGKKYKFVNAAQDYQSDPAARAYAYDQFGEYSLVQGGGDHFERWPNLASNSVLPRTIRVWLPSQAATHRLFVHDGQNLFTTQAPHGSWQLEQVVGSQTMVVGIDNTAARIDEYTHIEDFVMNAWRGGSSKEYCEFINTTLRPLMTTHYGSAQVEGIMGSSLGGLVSLACVLLHDVPFHFAASLSGTLGWGSIGTTNPTLMHLVAGQAAKTTHFYLDSGGRAAGDCADLDDDGVKDDVPSTDNYCTTRQMADTMADGGYVWNESLWHWWEPDALHNEAAWAHRVWRPLELFEALHGAE